MTRCDLELRMHERINSLRCPPSLDEVLGCLHGNLRGSETSRHCCFVSSLFPNCLEEVPDYIIPNKVRDEYRHGDEVHGPRWGLAYKQRFDRESNVRMQENQRPVRT